MTLALAGAQRTGKTTLAKAVADQHDFIYVPSRAYEVGMSLGIDINSTLTFDERMTAQEAILDAHIADLAKAKETNFQVISDRSTLDFAAYTMAEWGRNAPPGESAERLLAYVDKCLNVATWNYNGLVVVQPGIPYKVEAGKANDSRSFQELMNTLCFAYLRDSRVTCRTWFFRRDMTNLNERVASIETIWEEICAALECHATMVMH